MFTFNIMLNASRSPHSREEYEGKKLPYALALCCFIVALVFFVGAPNADEHAHVSPEYYLNFENHLVEQMARQSSAGIRTKIKSQADRFQFPVLSTQGQEQFLVRAAVSYRTKACESYLASLSLAGGGIHEFSVVSVRISGMEKLLFIKDFVALCPLVQKEELSELSLRSTLAPKFISARVVIPESGDPIFEKGDNDAINN